MESLDKQCDFLELPEHNAAKAVLTLHMQGHREAFPEAETVASASKMLNATVTARRWQVCSRGPTTVEFDEIVEVVAGGSVCLGSAET